MTVQELSRHTRQVNTRGGLSFFNCYWDGRTIVGHPVHTADGVDCLYSLDYMDDTGKIHLYAEPRKV